MAVGFGLFTVVAAGSEDSVIAPDPADLVIGPAEGALKNYCAVVPCTFISTATTAGISSGDDLEPGGSSTALSECPGAEAVIEKKGYYMPGFGGFDGPCPTEEQLLDIPPYTERDALIDELAVAPPGERADPAVLEAIRESYSD